MLVVSPYGERDGNGTLGSGTVTADPPGASVTTSSAGSAVHKYWCFVGKPSVTLTAKPGPGSVLDQWSVTGANGSDNTPYYSSDITIKVNLGKSPGSAIVQVSAGFKPVQQAP